MAQQSWENWSGSVRCAPGALHAPADEAAIVAIVRACAAEGRQLRVVGAGHSFTPLVATDGALMTLDHHAGLESVDPAGLRATVRAGTRIHALSRLLGAHGLAQENLGDIDVQSIAGAISTGTHGTGAEFGSLATQVEGLRLVAADGAIHECAADRDPELLRAAQVSLGALGVISALTLRLVPSFRLRADWRRQSLTQLLGALEGERERHRHFELFWFPHSDAALVKRLDVTDGPASAGGLLRDLTDLLVDNGGFWLLSELCRLAPGLSAPIARLCGALISEGSARVESHRAFAARRMVRFQEMEYSLPADAMAPAIEELRAMIVRERVDVHFPIECRYVRGDDIMLSPAYGRDSAYIAVHMYRGMPYQRYFQLAEAIFRRYDGRPHWGKLHTLGARELAPLYPEWERFQAIRRRLDPRGMFLNAHLRALFGA